MAKLTYLQLVNRVLRRINYNDLTSSAFTSRSGQALMISDFINEAQDYLFTETDWYSLYKTRQINTQNISSSLSYTFTAATGIPGDSGYVNATLAAAGLGSVYFTAGYELLISNTTSNNGLFKVAAVADSSTLTLAEGSVVTAETGSASDMTMPANEPVASDYGRTIDIMNLTDNILLQEDYTRTFDKIDPNLDTTGTVRAFTHENGFYRWNPIPAATTRFRERYWATPAALSAYTDTSDLPIECQNALIQYAWYKILEYQGEFETADRQKAEFNRQLKQAQASNKRKIDKMLIMDAGSLTGIGPPELPILPSTYDRRFR